MNLKLILLLSLFGLAMAIATVFWIPSTIEPAFWLVIFIFCAYIIAGNCNGKFFLNGFVLSLANCVWITGIHIVLYSSYISFHPEMAEMKPPFFMGHPRLQMLVTVPVFGVAFGLVQGLFAFIASKMLKRNSA